MNPRNLTIISSVFSVSTPYSGYVFARIYIELLRSRATQYRRAAARAENYLQMIYYRALAADLEDTVTDLERLVDHRSSYLVDENASDL